MPSWGARMALGVVTAVVACVDTSSLNDHSSDGPDATNGDASAPLGSDGAAADDAGAACRTLYVSPSGSDDADGCASASPLATLGKAIAVAKQRGLNGGEIHACRGVYRETLTLDVPVSIVGSFDCASWTQDAVEGPAWDAPTVIEAKDGLVTFTVTGPIDRATRIEAVRINGPGTGDGSSSALSIEGASPTVLHTHVIGGRTSSSAESGSIGVYLRAGAAPEIRESYIEGGSGIGQGQSAASTGLRAVGAGNAHITKSRIFGGRGTAVATNFTTFGAIINHSALTIDESEIDGGLGAAQQGGGVGVFVQIDSSVTLVHNSITAGATTTSSTTNASMNIGVYVHGTALIDRNRIIGGVPPNELGESQALLVGESAKDVVVTNNAIHGGRPRIGATRSSALGLAVLGTSSHTTIRYNTIFAGEPVGGGQARAVQINAGALGVTLAENLLLGHSGLASTGYVESDCSGATLDAVRGNVFVGFAQIARYYSMGTSICDALTNITSVEDLETKLHTAAPLAGVTNNVELRATCGTLTRCVVDSACTSPGAACLSSVLASWDEASLGTATLDGDGFALAPNVTCAIAKPTAAPPALAQSVDLAGTTRVTPISIGANELDGNCTP